MFSNSYDPFGFQSPYFGHGQRDRRRQQEIAQRQIMEEELRRKSEYERLKRMQRIKEQMAREEQQRRRQQEIVAQRQIMMEDELRRKSEYERRQRMQEKIAREEKQRRYMIEDERKRKAEYERRRRLELQRRHGMDIFQTGRSKKEEAARFGDNTDYYPPGTVVRGPDGNLYRVVTPSRHERDDIEKPGNETQCDQNTTTFDEKNKTNEASNDDMEMMSNSSDGSSECQDFDDDFKMENYPESTTDTVPAVQNNEQHHGIVVENVDEEEDDDLRELRSVWRNRIPSPGQWLEPVETFRE